MMLQKIFLNKLKEHFRLNIYEVKIWTALLSRGIASAAELADISGVPRSRCYDVLESLEKKGFIIMKIGKPIKYIAVQPEAIIERVKKDLTEKSKREEEFIEKIKTTDSFKELEMLHQAGIKHIDPSELSNLIKGRDNINRFIKSMVGSAHHSVKIVTSKEGLKRKARILKGVFKDLAKKGVNINIYANTKNNDYVKKLHKAVIINHIDTDSRFIIIDDSELIFMSPDKDLKPEYDTGIWIKSPFFVGAFNQLFENAL